MVYAFVEGGDVKMDQLLTTQEVAEKLRQDKTTVQKWSRLGILPVIKIGRKFLFDENDLVQWVKQHRVEKSPQERLQAMADSGREYFKKWCKTRKVDYRKLSEDKVMALINRAVAKDRKRHSA